MPSRPASRNTSGRDGVGLPRAKRALKGHRRVVPARTRYPMPWTLTAATAMLLFAPGFREAALAVLLIQVLLIQVCCLRPGELKKMRAEDLLPSSAQLSHWSVVIAPESRLAKSKTQVSDDTPAIAWPEWLGPTLGALVKHRDNSDVLFQAPYKVLLTEWRRCQSSLTLADVCMNQLRHGARTLGHRDFAEAVLQGGQVGAPLDESRRGIAASANGPSAT